MKKTNKREEREALDFWDEYYKSLGNSEFVDISETILEKEQRRRELEKDPVKWTKYYFSKYCTHEFTDFHLRFIEKAIQNPEIYLVNAWSRELAKTGVTFLVLMYLHMTGKKIKKE